jgi:hypothetical protein
MTDLFHFRRISIHFIQSALIFLGIVPTSHGFHAVLHKLRKFGKFMVFHVGFTWVSHGTLPGEPVGALYGFMLQLERSQMSQ